MTVRRTILPNASVNAPLGYDHMQQNWLGKSEAISLFSAGKSATANLADLFTYFPEEINSKKKKKNTRYTRLPAFPRRRVSSSMVFSARPASHVTAVAAAAWDVTSSLEAGCAEKTGGLETRPHWECQAGQYSIFFFYPHALSPQESLQFGADVLLRICLRRAASFLRIFHNNSASCEHTITVM